MKRIIIIAISLACWLTPGKAQVTGGADKEIRDLEAQRFHAMEKGDVETLDRIISDDLIYTHMPTGCGRQNSTSSESLVQVT